MFNSFSVVQKIFLVIFLCSPFYSAFGLKQFLKIHCVVIDTGTESSAESTIEEYKTKKIDTDYWKALDTKMSCLFERGKINATPFSQQRLDHDEALGLMEESIRQGSVFAQYIKAFYTRTLGTFEDQSSAKIIEHNDGKTIEDIIDEYKKVLKRIDGISNYPYVLDRNIKLLEGSFKNIYKDDEYNYSLQLLSIESVITFEYLVAQAALDDHEYLLIEISPINQETHKYTKLLLWPEVRKVIPSDYRSNTLPALSALKQSLNRCLKITATYKSYWHPFQYDRVQHKCKALSQYLPKITSLEEKRLEIEYSIYQNHRSLVRGEAVRKGACVDVLDCPEYDVLSEEINKLFSELSALWKEYNATFS